MCTQFTLAKNARPCGFFLHTTTLQLCKRSDGKLTSMASAFLTSPDLLGTLETLVASRALSELTGYQPTFSIARFEFARLDGGTAKGE